MPTSPTRPPNDGPIPHGFVGTRQSGEVTTPERNAVSAPNSGAVRRFYWELVAARQNGLHAAVALADPRLAPALAALRGAAGDEDVRIACVVELPESLGVEGADPSLTVRPLLHARDALARHDIHLDLWPQLPARARFLNTTTAATFQARLLPLLDAIEQAGDGVGVALDIEPSEELVKAAWSVRDSSTSLLERAKSIGGLVKGVGRALVDARQGRRDLTELARDLAARQVPLHAAVLPPLASARSDAWRTWALGCPIVDADGEPLFGTQAAMCYAPLAQRLPGQKARWSRDVEKRTLALWAARHRTAFDAVVVGQTATGILGDEPCYDSPVTFGEDVRAMEALGFTDVGVYALEGVLFGKEGKPWKLRDDVDDWLDAAFGRIPSTS